MLVRKLGTEARRRCRWPAGGWSPRASHGAGAYWLLWMACFLQGA